MYKHILIPTDGSALSAAVVRRGVTFAKSIHAKVTGITVSPSYHTFAVTPVMVTSTPKEYDADCKAKGEKHLGTIKEAAAAAGVSCDAVHVVNDHPYEAFIKTAKRKGCDLIFMASHGRKGISALVLGSETTKVLTHSKIPVFVCR